MGSDAVEPRYVDLKNTICQQIYKGVYRSGEKIPSERQLALDYEVSRITVRKAMELLEAEDLVVREVGNGTSITLKNYGNDTTLDVIALAAPSRNPFFAHFIAEFQRCVWDHDALLLYVEAPGERALEDCLYRLYSKDIRNAVVWPDDQKVDTEKLLRLRSIGMNMVFFDTDCALPYADSVFVDNEDAVRTLLGKEKERNGKEYREYLYIGWDNMEIANVRKREESFRRLCPGGNVLRVPWSRERKMAEASGEEIVARIRNMREGMILFGVGELAQELLGIIHREDIDLEKKRISLAAIDDFEGSDHVPVAAYNQDFEETAARIYRQFEGQIQKRSGWKAEVCTVRGRYQRW